MQAKFTTIRFPFNSKRLVDIDIFSNRGNHRVNSIDHESESCSFRSITLASNLDFVATKRLLLALWDTICWKRERYVIIYFLFFSVVLCRKEKRCFMLCLWSVIVVKSLIYVFLSVNLFNIMLMRNFKHLFPQFINIFDYTYCFCYSFRCIYWCEFIILE